MFARMFSLLVRPAQKTARRPNGSALWRESVRREFENGRLGVAERLLREVLRQEPDCTDAHRMLGSILGASGRLEEARSALEASLSLDPDNPSALADLGNVHRSSGRCQEAERCYGTALAADPNNRLVILNLALLYADSNREALAIELLSRLLLPPAHPDALQALIRLLDAAGHIDEARTTCEEVLNREPDHGAAHAALAFLLLKRYLDPERAMAHFQRALEVGYRNEEVLSNRGICNQDLGRLNQAIADYEAAAAIRPDYHSARFHRSLALLMLGQFERAWPDYDLRLQNAGMHRAFEVLPAWQGEALAATRLLVHGEQGLGDEIMFASCIDDLRRRCPDIVLACAPKLETIFRRSFPDISVIPIGQAAAAPRDCGAGVRVAIGSLPRYLRNSHNDFPCHKGYLRADPELVSEYRQRLEACGSGLKVGISWRGGTDITRRALRTLDAEALAALLDFPAQFVNLQYDSDGSEQDLAASCARGSLMHWQDALDDFDRTAALVCALDVVVSVCTAVIHLAGALGRPVLVMTPLVPEWRYGIATDAMPWYPSVTLIRQTRRGDWMEVVRSVHAHLTRLAASQ